MGWWIGIPGGQLGYGHWYSGPWEANQGTRLNSSDQSPRRTNPCRGRLYRHPTAAIMKTQAPMATWRPIRDRSTPYPPWPDLLTSRRSRPMPAACSSASRTRGASVAGLLGAPRGGVHSEMLARSLPVATGPDRAGPKRSAAGRFGPEWGRLLRSALRGPED